MSLPPCLWFLALAAAVVSTSERDPDSVPQPPNTIVPVPFVLWTFLPMKVFNMDDISKYKNAQERQMKDVCHPPPQDETQHSGSYSVLTVGPGVPLRIFIIS